MITGVQPAYDLCPACVGVFNGEALHIQRSDPMKKRVEQVLHHMKMPDTCRAKIISRLNTRDHPAAKRVAKLDIN
jgi:hypothetical protein